MFNPINHFRGWLAVSVTGLSLLAALAVPGAASAALLGNTLDLPLISYDNQGTTAYDAANDSFSVDASPTALLAPSNPPVVIDADASGARDFDINIRVDASGTLIGGVPGDDLVVTGEVTVPGMGTVSGVLLTGEITGFGYQDSGGPTDSFDFSFVVTGGALAYLYPGGAVGVTLSSESSTFIGDFSVDFGGEAKGTLGGITPDVAALGDRAWEDLNNNGVQDCSDSNGNGILGDVDPLNPLNPLVSDQGPECGDRSNGGAGIAGVAVNLFKPDANGDCTVDQFLQTVTGVDGLYLFENLPPGDYCVQFGTPPADFCDTDGFELGAAKFTGQNVGADETIDSDADPANGSTESVSLAAGETNRNLDAGYVCPAKIGDFVWEDLNQNGLQDNEPGVGGVTVRLFECGLDGIAGTADDVDTGESRVTSGVDGMYMFGAEPGVLDLPPGDYYVKFDSSTFPPGYDFTTPKAGDDALDSDCLPPDGIAACVTLGSRGINLRQDCGIVPPPPPQCDLDIDLLCRVEPRPSTLPGEKCEGKLQQFTVVWDGPGPVSIDAVNMGTVSNSGPINNGDEVTFFGPYGSNDVVADISGAVSGQSKFHVSCSDDDFNSPDDCGKLAGDGKGDDSNLLNLWLLEGFIDANGDVLDCNPDPNGGEFSQNCSVVLPPPPSCETLDKPRSLTFEYTGGDCPGDNDQGSKTSCSGAIDPAQMVSVSVNTDDGYLVSPSMVALGETFTITRGGSEFKSNTLIELSNGGGTQTLEVHTSCSAPLAVDDEFGALTLVGYDGQTGGAEVTFKYVVTNNGDPLADIDVTDDPFGFVGTIDFLDTDEMAMLTRLATITAGTTNIATASSVLDGLQCQASDTVIVEEQGPPPCEITPGEFKLEDDKIKWKLTNAGNDVATVESIEISAPDEFGAIKKVKLDGDIFKDDTRPMTWTFTAADFINDLKNRQIKVGDTKELLFETTEKFKQATADQISITVNFEEGCSVTFIPGAQPFVCSDAKPIDSLSMIWNGPDGVDVMSPAGDMVTGVVNGQEVTFGGLSGMGNDVFWSIADAGAGVSGSSRFHVSCSDSNMNGPEDCGTAQGNGKNDEDSDLNLWLLEGMAGANGIGFDCSSLLP